ncbi:MAG: SdpI family protein [Planctomycetaceae bacterium]
MSNRPIVTNTKTELMHIGVIVGMFIASAILWSNAPDQLPVHWNAKGEVDRYGGKFEGLLLLPLITVGVYALLRFIPVMDPGRENYAQFAKPYSMIRWGTTALMVAIHAAALAYVVGYQPDMGFVVGGSVSLLFLLLGNTMGKIRPNWFVGIRTPWTLSSKLSWTKTHRCGGWTFIGLGLLIGATTLVRSEWAVMMTIVASIGSSLGLVIYSYLVWRTDSDRVPPAGTSPAPKESNASE